MPLIERVIRAGKLDRPDSILLKNFLVEVSCSIQYLRRCGSKEVGVILCRRELPYCPVSSCISVARFMTLSPSVDGPPSSLPLSPCPHCQSGDLGHVLAVLGDVLFVLEQLVANRLLGIGGAGPKLRQPIDDVAERDETDRDRSSPPCRTACSSCLLPCSRARAGSCGWSAGRSVDGSARDSRGRRTRPACPS